MKQIENRGEALGISKLLLRENAGAAVARYVIEKFSPLPDEHIVIVCGTGIMVETALLVQGALQHCQQVWKFSCLEAENRLKPQR